MARRIGILGGTFDPPHLAHLIVARDAVDQLQLDAVVFMPAGEPWMKGDAVVSSAADRLEMTRIATSDDPAFEVSSVEIDRPGPTYTVDTLAQLQEAGTELFFIVGTDALAEISEWKEPERLWTMATFAVASRSGTDRAAMEGAVRSAPAGALIEFHVPALDISSSEIRRRVSQGGSIRYLVPDGVRNYIEKKGLYR